MSVTRIFVGYDDREPLAFHVLAHSILRRASRPVSITPLVRSQLPIAQMQEGSTQFTRTRFLVPWLCDFEGHAIFMDCDMLSMTDLSTVEKPDAAVAVVKHDYVPRSTRKFLGQNQSTYAKKNWSSFMVFNNDRCRGLSFDYVSSASLMALHQFQWTDDVAALNLDMNYLVGEDNQTDEPPKVVHFTNGGPWFPEYSTCDYSDAWHAERRLMEGS